MVPCLGQTHRHRDFALTALIVLTTGGGDVVLCHNALTYVSNHFIHRARLGGQIEVDHGSGADSSHSLPADILVLN